MANTERRMIVQLIAHSEHLPFSIVKRLGRKYQPSLKCNLLVRHHDSATANAHAQCCDTNETHRKQLENLRHFAINQNGRDVSRVFPLKKGGAAIEVIIHSVKSRAKERRSCPRDWIAFLQLINLYGTTNLLKTD